MTGCSARLRKGAAGVAPPAQGRSVFGASPVPAPEPQRVRRRRRPPTVRVVNDERTGAMEALRNVPLDRLLGFLSAFPISLRRGTESVVGVGQAGLEIADDRAEKARGEQPRPEGTGRILTDGRQLSQGGSGRRGHTAKLPADLLAASLRPVRGGQSSGLGGIRGGTQGVGAHMGMLAACPAARAAATAAGALTSRAAA